MSDALAKTIRETLEGGRAGAAVFLLREGDGLMPHVARDASDPLIDKAYGGDERYPMATFAAVLQPRLEETWRWWRGNVTGACSSNWPSSTIWTWTA